MTEANPNTAQTYAASLVEAQREAQMLTAELAQLRADFADVAATLQGVEPILAQHNITIPAETKRKMLQAQQEDNE